MNDTTSNRYELVISSIENRDFQALAQVLPGFKEHYAEWNWVSKPDFAGFVQVELIESGNGDNMRYGQSYISYSNEWVEKPAKGYWTSTEKEILGLVKNSALGLSVPKPEQATEFPSCPVNWLAEKLVEFKQLKVDYAKEEIKIEILKKERAIAQEAIAKIKDKCTHPLTIKENYQRTKYIFSCGESKEIAEIAIDQFSWNWFEENLAAMNNRAIEIWLENEREHQEWQARAQERRRQEAEIEAEKKELKQLLRDRRSKKPMAKNVLERLKALCKKYPDVY